MTTTYNILHMPDMIDIGYQTESCVREIGFDVKPWLEAYGDLTLSIWLTRPGEDVAYPAADVERMGTVLYWTPNGADTAIDGVGRVEVLGLTGEKRKLSGWCRTLVRATSLAKTQDPPEAAAPWVDSVLGAAARITGMQVATETLEAGSDATAKWDGDAGLLTLGIPSGVGPKGDPGAPGKDAEVDATLTQEGQAADAKVTGEEIGQLKNDLVNAIDYIEIENTIAINAKGGYFAAGNGYLNWAADAGRRSAIVPINSAKRYKLTTNIRSAAIYGLFCISADNPTPEALFYCTILDKKYKGNGSTRQTISEEIVIPDGCTHIVIQSTDKTEPVLCEIDEMSVFRAYTKEESDKRYAQNTQIGNPHMVTDLVIHVGDDMTATPFMGSGWASTETNSYTHAVNGKEDLSLEFSGDVGSVYLVEFDTSFTGGEFVRVGIGTGYRVLAYNGTNHIVLPLTAYSNTTLYITPYTSGINTEFTISGLKIRKIQDAGDAVTLSLNSVYTDNHQVAYGFWNVLLGNAAPVSSASTRTVAIGHNALSNLQGGHRNVAIGTFALSKLIGGENNIAIGSDSLYLVEYANNNLSIGNWSMQHAEGATECIAIGQYALENCGATRNVAIGGLAGGSLSGTSAWKNTYIGYRAGKNNVSGGSNVAIGYDAKGGKNGSRNVNIGENSEMNENVSDSIAIGAGVCCTESNQIMIGKNTVQSVIIAGKRINFNEDGTVTWESV